MPFNKLGRAIPTLVGTTRRGTAGPARSARGRGSVRSADRDRHDGLDDTPHGALLDRPPQHAEATGARPRNAMLRPRQGPIQAQAWAGDGARSPEQTAEAVRALALGGAIRLHTSPANDRLPAITLMIAKRMREFTQAAVPATH